MSFGFDHDHKDYKLVIVELNNVKNWDGTMFGVLSVQAKYT